MNSGARNNEIEQRAAGDGYYRMLAEASSDAVYVIGRNLRFEYANAAAAAYLGRQVDEVIGHQWRELMPEEHFQEHLGHLREVLKAGKPSLTEELIYMPGAGREVWLSNSLTPIFDAAGQVSAVMGVSRDISRMKEAELRLVESERRYRMLAETAQDFIFIIDTDGIVTYVNDHGARLFGLPPAAIIGTKMTELFPGDIGKRQAKSIEAVIRADMPSYQESYAVMPAGGMWLGTSLSPIKDDEGNVTAVLGIARDMTAKKKAEAELVAERDFFRTAINHMPGIFYLIDRDGRFIRWNQAFERVSGYSSQEIAAMNPIDFFKGDDRELIASRIAEAFAHGQVEVEADLVSKDGATSTRYYFTGYRMEAGGDNYLVGIGTDISSHHDLERELAMQRDRAQRYLDITPAMIFILDVDGAIRLLNQKGSEMLECEPRHAIGLDWFENFLPREDRDEVRAVFDKLVTGDIDPVEFYENPIITRSGSRRTIAWHNALLHDDEGNIAGILSSGEDVTERRIAESELRDSEQRFKAMFDTDINGILLADLETKGFALGNDTICKMLGYTHEELATMGVSDIHPAEEQAAIMKQFERQARGEINIARNLPVQRKDGSVFYADISTARVVISGITYLMGYFVDTTERHLSDVALMESEEKYRSIFEESNDVIFISTPAGRFTDINPAGVKLFGYASREEMLKLDIGTDLFTDPEVYRLYLITIKQSGAVKNQELKLRKKNGEEVTVSITASEIRDSDGALSGYRGIMRDISEQRHLQRQLVQAQKMESIGNLAGGVAHDFNNYLTAIQGYADLGLLELPEESELHEYLSEIRNSAVRAADLTRQLLLFGRREEVNLQPVDLGETISELQKMLGRLIGERYQINTGIAVPLDTIIADKGLVEQVIVNLVVNSRDAMPDGGEILLEADNRQPAELPVGGGAAAPAHYVRLAVTDSGTGMDNETLEHIFEPFFTTKDIGKGTGLGLSVVYGIVSQHGGSVDVESDPDLGTTFNIYFPAAPGRAGGADESQDDIAGAIAAGERLLLVEDNDAVRNLAELMLTEMGFAITVASSASEATAIFAREQGDFVMVFSDVILPDKSGLVLAQELHQMKPDLGIILASGYTGDHLNRSQIEAEGYRFLQKPYNLSELYKVVGQVLKGRRRPPR